MTDSWSINTNDWSFCGDSVYVENPEWIYVLLDAEKRILAGLKPDGGVEWSIGIPTPVKTYIDNAINEIKNGTEGTGIDGLNKIIAFLSEFSTSDALKDLLDTKVDKEEGKSLVDTEYASSIQFIENPEFAAVWLDNDEHILFGVQTDCNFLFGCGIPNQIKEYIKQKIDELSLDEYKDIVAFLNDLEKGDKTLQTLLDEKVDKEDGKSLIDEGVAASQSVIEDPENRHEIATDSENKIISYRKHDGTKVENVGFESHRIATDSLNLSESGMTEFQQALKDSGFQPGGVGDLSDVMSIETPEPKKYGMINLFLDSLPVTSTDIRAGYAVYYDYYGNSWKKPCEITIQGQSTRVYAATGGKGNYTLDITDGSEIKFGDWVPQDSFHLKGHAVDVTRAKLPTAYKLAYKIIEYLDAKPNRVLSKESQITATHATGDRFSDWDDGARCIPDGFPIELYVNGEYWGLYSLQLKKHRKNYSMDKSDYESFFLDADAMMTSDYTHGIWNDGPDAASEVAGKTWWNGFEIKNPKNLICMDGSAYDGDNPKELIDSTSQYYDSSNKKHIGSAKTKSIIRNFSTKYNEVMSLITSASYIVGSSSDSSFISNKTKTVFGIFYLKEPADGTLNGVTKTFPANTELFQSGENIYAIGDAEDYEAAKPKFAEYFDVNSCIAVTIFNCFMRNFDSIKKNTLWGTYKNGKIAAFFWDLDAIYGQGTFSIGIPAADAWYTYKRVEWPIKLLSILFDGEIKTAYSNLRRDGIISVKSWREVFFGWVNRVGADAYKRDIEKWNETVTYRKNFTNTDYWEERPNDSAADVPLWSNSENYAIGDKVKLVIYPNQNSYLVYQAIQPSSSQDPQCPVTEFYEGYPQVGGYYDSPKRMEKWVEAQITVSDNYMNYKI